MTYSSSVSISKQKYSSRGQNSIRYETRAQRKLGPISNTIVLLVMACLVGLVYLTQVTKTNRFSYEIDRLETRQSELREEQKDLELTAARLRSIDSERVAQASQNLINTPPSGTIQN